MLYETCLVNFDGFQERPDDPVIHLSDIVFLSTRVRISTLEHLRVSIHWRCARADAAEKMLAAPTAAAGSNIDEVRPELFPPRGDKLRPDKGQQVFAAPSVFLPSSRSVW